MSTRQRRSWQVHSLVEYSESELPEVGAVGIVDEDLRASICVTLTVTGCPAGLAAPVVTKVRAVLTGAEYGGAVARYELQ